MSSISMIICLIGLIIISTTIDPYWQTSFFRNIRAYVDIYTHAKILEISTHAIVSFAFGLGVCITRSPIFHKFIYHILDIYLGKET